MEAGMAKDSGPIAELLADHARAREFWQAIEKNARIVLGGGTNARLELARQAAGYVALLTGHIRAEEQNLFPSLQLIPTDVQAELAPEFERIESAYVEAGIHDTYYGLAEKLANEAAGEVKSYRPAF